VRPSHPLVIAHRGASGYRPENTVSAFELAVDQRADMIEIDLHRARDGAIAIRHDEHFRSLGCDRAISAMDMEEIRELDAGDGQSVPVLDEVLDRFGREIAFNLELKRGSEGCYPGLEADALEAVERRGLLGSTLFSSFDDGILERLRALSSAARLAVLVSPRRPQRALERARAIAAESINPQLGLAVPALIEAAHADGLAILVYTVDEIDDMRRLLNAGVDGLFTNYPDRLRALLETPRGR
jgi:glycerophosphoryl diester phosphodiesterase